jgi:hypothetical protein
MISSARFTTGSFPTMNAPGSINCGVPSSPPGTKGGKDDPKLQLLRFEPDRAQIWLNENSLFAGIKLMLGKDPKEEYKDKVAELDLAS